MRKIIIAVAITAGILTAAQFIALITFGWLSVYNVIVPQPTNFMWGFLGTVATGFILGFSLLWLNDN